MNVGKARPSPALTISSLWRSFRLSSWLGWQIESNWADPFLFAIYSLIKPLASVMILVVMYSIITEWQFCISDVHLYLPGKCILYICRAGDDGHLVGGYR